jgi:uncharacterized protein YbbC (DUF1343 family)
VKLGIDRLLEETELRELLAGRRVALLGHAASITSAGRHSLDALVASPGVEVSAAFGPQHGMRADKQDNMIETSDERHPEHGIPVFSLYGEVRRPTPAMLDGFDAIVVDLQDVGTRVYTYVTTLRYLLEACGEHGKVVIVADRPNPAGRPVEGSLLESDHESFVGAAAMPMRHGMTLGELARWFVAEFELDVELHVVRMEGWDPDEAPGQGWPLHVLPWVNPSPNASSLNMVRVYPGTVMIEGTTLSEGRGTSTPLELLGAPDLDTEALLGFAREFAPGWLEGCLLRRCTFEPTFHKHAGETCEGVQLHTDFAGYGHDAFRPYRLVALLLKAFRQQRPHEPLWRDFVYEYESDRLAIDLITGGTFLREWVDDPGSTADDLDTHLAPDEIGWMQSQSASLLY